MRFAPEVIARYPGTLFGLLMVTGLDGKPDRAAWAALKNEETAAFRSAWAGYERKDALRRPPLSWYAGYYKQFKKTYPVQLQMESVLLKGREVEASCLAVETMFLAEVKHGLLVAGHDPRGLCGGYRLDVARGGERLLAVSGQERVLKAGDLFMADEARILSSVLEGQDYETRLTKTSPAALYCVYGVSGVTDACMEAFFQDLHRYTKTAFPDSEMDGNRILRPE